MRWQLFIGLVVALGSGTSLSGQTQEIQDQVAESLKLQGTWVFESATYKGKPTKIPDQFNLVFTRDKVVMLESLGAKVRRTELFNYEIDVKKNPRVLIIHTWSDRKGIKEKVETTQQAIYEVDGDTLRYSPAGPNQALPTSFDDEKMLILTFQRKK